VAGVGRPAHDEIVRHLWRSRWRTVLRRGARQGTRRRLRCRQAHARQAREALAICDALDAFHRKTGRAITPLQAVSGYIEAVQKLGEQHTLDAAVTGYLTNVATVRRVRLSDAIQEFRASYETKSTAANGKRPQISPVYAYMTGNYLNRLDSTFNGYDLGALIKENLDLGVSGTTRARRGPASAVHRCRLYRHKVMPAMRIETIRKSFAPVLPMIINPKMTAATVAKKTITGQNVVVFSALCSTSEPSDTSSLQTCHPDFSASVW